MLNCPSKLKEIQEWFATIITSPLTNDQLSQPIARAKEFLIPSPTLTAEERIQIYNQQYWWRLLKILQKYFPLVTRLFGYTDFNQIIGVPYLQTYPPDHWSLYPLGDKLLYWLKKTYFEPDRKLVYISAEIDTAYHKSFIAKSIPLTEQINVEQKLQLQPHLSLFSYKANYFKFRDDFLAQEVDYWLENDFPPLLKEKTYYFVLFRTLSYQMEWREISSTEYLLLNLFKKGHSILSACEHLETKGNVIYEEACDHIQTWLHNWISHQWLELQKN